MKFNFTKPNILRQNWMSLCAVGIGSLLCPNVTQAGEIPDADTNYFVVTENDSTQILFPILDKPVITLNETTVNIDSASKTYSAEIAEILDFSFIGYDLDAVKSIQDLSKGIEFNHNAIIIKGLSTGETVSLFDLKGVTVATYTSKEENMVVDLNQLPTGVYILSTKNANYKIKK